MTDSMIPQFTNTEDVKDWVDYSVTPHVWPEHQVIVDLAEAVYQDTVGRKKRGEYPVDVYNKMNDLITVIDKLVDTPNDEEAIKETSKALYSVHQVLFKENVMYGMTKTLEFLHKFAGNNPYKQDVLQHAEHSM